MGNESFPFSVSTPPPVARRSVPVLRLRLLRRRGGFRLIHRDVPGKERGAEGESWERVTPGLVQQRVRAPRVRADEWVGGHRIVGPRAWLLNICSDVGVRTNERSSSRYDASFNPFMMKELAFLYSFRRVIIQKIT